MSIFTIEATNASRSLDSASIVDSKEVDLYSPVTKEQKPILNALVIFDYREGDRNGCLLMDIRDALVSEVPLFCQVATILGIHLDPFLEIYEDTAASIAKNQIRDLLKTEAAKWDLFVDCHEGGQLVILPKSYFGSCCGPEKLDLLGINTDRIVPISVEELLKINSAPQASLESFFLLFQSNSETRFRLRLIGHSGISRSIAGLSLEMYQKFLEFFDQLHCDALFVHTCFAGGSNRKYQSAVKYPVILMSLGNFYSCYKCEEYKTFFRRLDQAFMQSAHVTREIFFTLLQKSEWIADWRSLAQIRMPGQREFQLLNEDGSVLVITEDNAGNSGQRICAEKIRLLALEANSIRAILDVGKSRPLILSTRFDNPTHVISEFRTQHALYDLFQATIVGLRSSKKHRQKVVFERLHCRAGTFKDLVFIWEKQTARLLTHNIVRYSFFHEKHEYFHLELNEVFECFLPKEISKETYEKFSQFLDAS